MPEPQPHPHPHPHPLVSIVTPTYNHERFVAACVESVRAQTYPHWELLAVDDGSTDGTWQILERLAAADPRVRPVRQPNKGIWRLAETYNGALARARGPLVAVLEGDDRWPPGKLAAQVPAHLGGGLALSFGQVRQIDVAGEPIAGAPYPPADYLRPDAADLFARLLRGEYYVPAVTVLIDREALTGIGGFQQPDYIPAVDYPTWLRLGALGGLGFVPELLGYWRRFPSQTTWLLGRENAYGTYRLAKEMARDLAARPAGAPLGCREADLLTPVRRHFLADSSHKAAALAFERGEPLRAARFCAEIAGLGQHGQLARCLAMLSWKAGRQTVRRVRPARGGPAEGGA